jgi:hypothetical protein
MEFTLSTSGHFYPEDDRRKELEKFGFTFKKSKYKRFMIDGSPIIEINSLEELIKLADQFHEIIVRNGFIEIYDDYRE